MDLIEFYKKETKKIKITPLIMIVISSVSQGLILTVIINAVATISKAESNFQYVMMYFTLMAIFIYCKRYSQQSIAEDITIIMSDVRLRISDKIRKSEYLLVENMGSENMYKQLTHDTGNITQFIIWMINASQSCILVVICIFYILIVSQTAFILIFLFLCSILFFYFVFFHKNYDEILAKSLDQEISTMKMLNQLFLGFKELKINKKMSDDYFYDYNNLLNENQELKIETGYRFITQFMFSQAAYFSFFGLILFVLPVFFHAPIDVLKKIIATGIFIMGPFNTVISCVPLYAKTNNALNNINNLENKLDFCLKDYKYTSKINFLQKFKQFQNITFSNLTFSHHDINGDVSFQIGPISLKLKKGELIFVTGGNGSGKTSLMKLLCGLYYPDNGLIKVDNTTITKEIYPSYRDLFSMILSDYYLFDRIYGVEDINENHIQKLLKKMQLTHKTSLINRQFTNIDLSTGQKKRLALIYAMLQNKDIYIFDEWAADQDSEFRLYFYETLLKELINKGKTIITVSHDDRYYHLADRVLKMDYGKFIEI